MNQEEQMKHAISEPGPEAKELKKLYRLRSIAARLPHRGCVYPNVQFTWFVDRNRPPVSYREAILNYEPSEDGHRGYDEGGINQLFTDVEAKVFAAYLLAVHDDVASIEEVVLPVDHIVPVDAVALGGGVDCYMIHKEPEYNLSFKVLGLFDVTGDQPIDEAGKKMGMRPGGDGITF